MATPAPLSRLRQILRSRQDSEHEQALVRIGLATGVLLYLLALRAFPIPNSPPADYVVVLAIVYFIYSIANLAHIVARPGVLPPRRALATSADISTVTVALCVGGEVAAPFFGGYLWITIANGLRFGRRALYLTNMLAAVGFAIVLGVSEYWREQVVLGVGFLVWLILLPGYVGSLLERLEKAVGVARSANEAKSQFLANMSHELRTPLNAIMGYSEMLREDAEADGRNQDVADLKKVQSSATHLLGLINGILDLSKVEAGRMELSLEWVSIAKLMDEVSNTVRPLADKHGDSIELRVQEGIGEVYTDAGKLRQVLVNLLSNAAKFTRDGRVRVEVGARGSSAGEQVLVTVADNGIGMSEDQLSRVFQPFMQADASTTREYGGTGLGLAITKRFCDLLGAHIRVDSQLHAGSTFTVTLPRRFAESAATVGALGQIVEPKPTRTTATLLQGERRKRVSTILVIDDDAAVRELMARFFSREGFRVRTEAGGMEGLRAARKQRPDVVLLDVMMPGMDGWDVLRAFQEDSELASVPVVMMSLAPGAEKGYALGATDYVPKPIDWSRLDATVKASLRGEHKSTVLVVDDDPSLRSALRAVLERDGWKVAEAADGRQAMARVNERRPALVILDLVMPHMNGFEFMAELAKRPDHKSIPVIVTTGSELSEAERAGLLESAERIVAKGHVDGEMFLRELRDLVNQRLDVERPRGDQAVAG